MKHPDLAHYHISSHAGRDYFFIRKDYFGLVGHLAGTFLQELVEQSCSDRDNIFTNMICPPKKGKKISWSYLKKNRYFKFRLNSTNLEWSEKESRKCLRLLAKKGFIKMKYDKVKVLFMAIEKAIAIKNMEKDDES